MRGATFNLPRLMNNGYDAIDTLAPMQQMTAAWADYAACSTTGLGAPGLASHMVGAGPAGAHAGAHLSGVASPWVGAYGVNNNSLAPGADPSLVCAHLGPGAELQGAAGPLSPYPVSSASAASAPAPPGVAAVTNSAPASLGVDGGPLSGAVVPPGPSGGVGKPAPGKVNRKGGQAAKRRRGAAGVGASGRPASRSPSALLEEGPAGAPGSTSVAGATGVPSLAAAVAAAAGGPGAGAASGSHKSCVVCSDRAVNNNFGQITCESCKAFFRRNAHKMEKLNCTGKGRCQITTDSRKNCPRCRLEKCFHMGMRKELIQVRKKDGSAPKWLDGNSPDSGSGGSAGPQPSRPQAPAQPQAQAVSGPGPSLSSSRPLSVGSSTEGSPALEVGHLGPDQPAPFLPSQPASLAAQAQLGGRLPHCLGAPPLGASSPVAAAVCISPRQRPPPPAGLGAFEPAGVAGAGSGAGAGVGGPEAGWESGQPPAHGPAAPNGFSAAMFAGPGGQGQQCGASELSSSLRIFRDLVGPSEEERSPTPDRHPLLQHLEGLVATLFDNFNYNHQHVNLDGLSLEYEPSWGLEFAVLADILLRQLIHFLRHNEVTKYDSARQDIEAIKAGLMNALPIFLALNVDKATGYFRFNIDGQSHEVNGQRLEAALASIFPPETDILKYLVSYNTSVAALLNHKRDLFGLYLLLKIMAPSFEAPDTTSGRAASSLPGASWSAPGMQAEGAQWRYSYKDIYDILCRALRETNQSEATLGEMLKWSKTFDLAFRKAFSMKLGAHPPHILPKLVYEFVNIGPGQGQAARRMATSL